MGQLIGKRNLLKDLDKILITLCLLSVLSMIVIQILARMLGISFFWTQEFASFSYVWSIFLGVVLVYRKDEHIKISLFFDLLPDRLQKLVRLLTELIVASCAGILFAPSVQYALDGMKARSPAMQIPMFFIDVSIPVCLIMVFYQSAKRVVRLLRPGIRPKLERG